MRKKQIQLQMGKLRIGKLRGLSLAFLVIDVLTRRNLPLPLLLKKGGNKKIQIQIQIRKQIQIQIQIQIKKCWNVIAHRKKRFFLAIFSNLNANLNSHL